MKRNLWVLYLLLVVLLTACGGEKTPETTPPPVEVEIPYVEETMPPLPYEGVELTLQSIWWEGEPQAFDYRLLLEAYQKGNFTDVTDETRIMYEYHGIKPVFIETGSNLFKVTYPGDLSIIESIYNLMFEANEK